MTNLSINNCDSEEVAQLYAHQLAAVAEIGRAITANLHLPTQLNTLVERLQADLGYYGVNVWINTEPAEAVQLKGGRAPNGEDLAALDLHLAMHHDNAITQVCRQGEYVLHNDLPDAGSLPLAKYYPETRAQLVLPLKIAQKNVGALELLSRQAHAFEQDNILLLRSLADQATIAIRNATLYQAEQSRRHLAEKLYQVNLALTSTLKLDEVLELILSLLDEIVPSERSSVMLREGETLEFMAAHGFPPGINIANARIPLDDDRIYSHVFNTQVPLAIPDVQLYPEWHQMSNLPPARSWMGVPLIVNERVIGMLSLARERFNPYTLHETTLTQTFASQAAIALENARLYARLARFNQQLEERVQERTNELQDAYGKLERLDQTKTNFIQVTSHELRTPLTVLLGYSQMLLQNQMIGDDGMLSQLVAGIYSGADRLHDIVNSMLDIVKIDSLALELSPEPVSLDLLVRNVAGNFKNALRHREINLSIDNLHELPHIEADNAALQKVFYQLVSNAIKYTPNGGYIHIYGRPLMAGERIEPAGIEVVVADQGIGIDPRQQELIFTKFYQTGQVALHSTSRTQFKGGGPGLGLPIARGIVQAHSGKLWVESSGYDEAALPGSKFYVVLPLGPNGQPPESTLEEQLPFPKRRPAAGREPEVDFRGDSAYT